MSDHTPKTTSPINWLLTVIFLTIITVISLYTVRNNYNERQPSSEYSNKDTRSDHVDTLMQASQPDSSSTGRAAKPDSIGNSRERASMPEADTTRK